MYFSERNHHCLSMNQKCKNSIWNNDDNLREESIKYIIQLLVNFLGEILSNIQCKQFFGQFQSKKLVDIAEHIHQLRLTLLTKINNIHECKITFDISSISLILHELVSCIHCLGQQQQQSVEYPSKIMFKQILDRLEKSIKSFMNYININHCTQVFLQSFSLHISYFIPKEIVLEFANIDKSQLEYVYTMANFRDTRESKPL